MAWEMGAVRVIFVIIITAAAITSSSFWLVRDQICNFRVSPRDFLYFL